MIVCGAGVIGEYGSDSVVIPAIWVSAAWSAVVQYGRKRRRAQEHDAE